MAKFLLHGLWVQRSGLHLWIEQVAGHRIVVPESVPEGTFPPAVADLLTAASFRHRLRTTLRTPKGREVALTIPTAAYAPAEAMSLLGRLEFLDEPGPAATKAHREAIAPDLMWLVRMYRGLYRFVRAGGSHRGFDNGCRGTELVLGFVQGALIRELRPLLWSGCQNEHGAGFAE